MAKKACISMAKHVHINDMDIFTEKDSKVEPRLLLAVEMAGRPMVVYASEREKFLTPFVYILKNNKADYGLQGPKQMAKLLCSIVDFRKADNKNESVEWETIEQELCRLKSKLFKDE